MDRVEPGGRAGGNHFGGDYEFEGGALSFGQIAMTKMACPAMEVEARFHAALGATAAAEVADDRLLLLDGGGQLLAMFVRDAAQ